MLTDFENSAMWACLFLAALAVYFGYATVLEGKSQPVRILAWFLLAAAMIVLAWTAPW
jgi:hypothetical protein